MQLDIWVPEYRLALEYQGSFYLHFIVILNPPYLLGEHHYYDIHRAFGSTSKMFVERDQKKKSRCIEKGVSLVCIPYWYSFPYHSFLLLLHLFLLIKSFISFHFFYFSIYFFYLSFISFT
jgi:hypothetical protein